MTKAYFHLPGLFEFYDFYKEFLPIYKEYPRYFYDFVEISSVYGAPNDCIWSGGRFEVSDVDIATALDFYASYHISCRFTFSNSLLNASHLNDARCNQMASLLSHYPNSGIIIYSDLLLNYLKQHYPSFYYVSSTTKVLTSFEQLRLELQNDNYRYVVPDFRLNHAFDQFASLKPEEKQKLEFLVNECCDDSCLARKQCYETVSRQILGDDIPDHICSSKSAKEGYRFSKAMANPAFISLEDIIHDYLPQGLNNFKIEGRGLGSALLLEFILYYMVKPQYHIHIRERLYLDNNLDLF